MRGLWTDRPDRLDLVRLDHVDLGDREVAEDLSRRLDRPTFEPVIRADIASSGGGEASHAEQVDAQMGASYATRLATASYLYSLTSEVPGVTAGELVGSILAPGDDPVVMQKALENLEATAWYLHVDARGYRFSTELSLNKLVEESIREVTTQKTKTQATRILAEQFRDGALRVRRAWEDAKVPDRSEEAQLELDELGEGVALGEAEALAREAIQEEVERRQAQRRAVEAVRETRRELVLRRRFVELVREMIRSECARARLDGRERLPAISAWHDLRDDHSSGWQYAETFRLTLGVELRELVPEVGDGDRPTLTRAAGYERLRELMHEWRESAGGGR